MEMKNEIREKLAKQQQQQKNGIVKGNRTTTASKANRSNKSNENRVFYFIINKCIEILSL